MPRPSPATRFLPLLIIAALAAAIAKAAELPALFLGTSGKAPPALYPFLPAADKNTGGTVVIVPALFSPEAGGDSAEVAQLGRWFKERGINAFVFRGRDRPEDSGAWVADLNRAIRTLRVRAAEFRISPERIAILGIGRGAEIAADAAYNHAVAAATDSADPLTKFSSRPNQLGLIWGGRLPAEGATNLPPTFLVGTSVKSEGAIDMVALWTNLRASRTSVDVHLFPQPDTKIDLAAGAWPEMFFNWARFGGLLTDEPRVALKGMVYLDGHALPHGYVILTPIGFAGAGPIVGRVLNSTAGSPIGEFSVPANQGPIAGRYKLDVRENAARWLSNSFSGDLVGGRGGGMTPEKAYFGHHRVLTPTLADQPSFTKVRPSDAQDYVIEIKPGADANLAMKIEVFSK